VATELGESKAALEQLLGCAVEDLAFPHGAYNADVLDAAFAAGYARVYTLDPVIHRDGASGVVGRFSMSPDVWWIEFVLVCDGAYVWLRPWRRCLSRLRSALRSTAKKEPQSA
jgi:hypothetical protein